MKSRIISGLVLLCVIVCTVIVYRLIFDELSTLFYVNVTVACVAETILLINIPILSNRQLLTFKNAASSIVLDIFAIVLFLWTSIYSLFVEEKSDYRILYIGLLVTIIIFIFLFGSVEMGGSFMQKEEKRQQQVSQEKRMFSNFLTIYYMEVCNILITVNAGVADEIKRILEMVLDKISTIPSEKLERNESVTTSIYEKLNEIKALVENLRKEDTQETNTQIIHKLESFNNYVTTIKSTL